MAMCGRYTHLLNWSQIVELYRLTLPDEPKDLRPSYNVAPTHVMPIIRPAGNGRELVMAGGTNSGNSLAARSTRATASARLPPSRLIRQSEIPTGTQGVRAQKRM